MLASEMIVTCVIKRNIAKQVHIGPLVYSLHFHGHAKEQVYVKQCPLPMMVGALLMGIGRLPLSK